MAIIGFFAMILVGIWFIAGSFVGLIATASFGGKYDKWLFIPFAMGIFSLYVAYNNSPFHIIY